MMKSWFRDGEHWIWLNAGAVAINVIMVVGLLLVILIKGMGHFWPSTVYSITYDKDGTQQVVAGSIVSDSMVKNANDNSAEDRRRYFIKVANRKLYGADFRWLWFDEITDQTIPENIVVLERTEWGDFYGYFDALVQSENEVTGEEGWKQFIDTQTKVVTLAEELISIRKSEVSRINARLEKLRLKQRKLELDGEDTPAKIQEIEQEQIALKAEYQQVVGTMDGIILTMKGLGHARFRTASGELVDIALSDIINVHLPNQMNLLQQIGYYCARFWDFVTGQPREANTEGGIFPAIFGTVAMVFLMTIIATPFGVVAAVYLREYAKQGIVVRLIRISVNNLAGVPSIVYGVFGLGFFVYFLGGNLDKIFYPEVLPAPTFGTPGLLWASATLALLTLPVVIVSTEEGLARIPRSLREGSLALGATRYETIKNVIIPMASPAIMTGVILAIARAAGEVAPLMLVGVVKLAPDLAVDAVAPFVHLERKFMHLGFHIFDLGFQSPNVDAARPLVFATSFLLVIVIIVLNLSAIWVRNKLRERYKAFDY